ncbi:MAG: hypothetical protein QOG13_1866 [Sphingomonadales bacterium]|jgi:phage-related protein|nr:hypothetical protein [Sphingomonadales bacterium]
MVQSLSPQKIDLVFYKSASGNEPVRDWLNALPVESRRLIGRGELYALHGFIKKARAIPPADLKLAQGRKKEVEHG